MIDNIELSKIFSPFNTHVLLRTQLNKNVQLNSSSD